MTSATPINTLHSRSNAVFMVTTITFIFSTCFVVARLVSRFAVIKTKTWDDWFMIVSWFLAFALSFAVDYGTSKGLGRHDIDINPEWVPGLRKSEYAFTILYNPALMATKTSILIFYLRMSRNTQTVLRIASYVTLGIVNIAGVVLTFLNAFQCMPVPSAFNNSVNGKCMSIITLYLASAPVNIITDLAILVLPIPVLTGVRLPQKQKVILIFTFAMGIFVAIVDVVRIFYLQQASRDSSSSLTFAKLGTGEDFAYNASLAFMWSAVEVNVGIICACIPTLKPLVKRILPSMITDYTAHGHTMEKFGSVSSQKGESGQPLTVHQTYPMRPIPPMSPMPQVAFPPMSPTSGTRPLSADPYSAGHREEEESMDMIDFLTAPNDIGIPARPSYTARTNATENSTYFGFVSMKKPKSMMKTSGKESLKYCTLVTILFFLWGFSYGLLNTLNGQIATLAKMTQSQTLGLTSAYFGGYFIGASTIGQWVLRQSGFKSTFIVGLCIYGTGTLMFWPSAVLTSFPGFLISNVVVGSGLSVLETAANPFLALCGPMKYAEFRLLVAQGVQAVGSILSQSLAEKVLFADIEKHPTLIDVQWAYLAIALFTVILALFFYYTPLPEASDADLQAQSEYLDIYPGRKFELTGTSIVFTTLVLAIFAQALYVAAQESFSVYFEPLIATYTPFPANEDTKLLALAPANWLVLGHALFALGRFIFAPLCLFLPPRFLLLFAFVATTLLSTCLFAVDSLQPASVLSITLLIFFFEGPIFPLIFAIGLRGMGRYTKVAAAGLVTAVSGGAIFPFIVYAVQSNTKRSEQYSFVVVMAAFLGGMIFPIYLCVAGENVKHQVDPRDGGMRLGSGFELHGVLENPTLGMGNRTTVQADGDQGGDRDHGGDREGILRRVGEGWSWLVRRLGSTASTRKERKGRKGSEEPVAKHMERGPGTEDGLKGSK